MDLLVEGGWGGDGRLAGGAGERGSPRGSGAGADTRGGAACPAPPPGSQRPPLTEPFIHPLSQSRERGGGFFFLSGKCLDDPGGGGEWGAAELKGRRTPCYRVTLTFSRVTNFEITKCLPL